MGRHTRRSSQPDGRCRAWLATFGPVVLAHAMIALGKRLLEPLFNAFG